MSGLTEKEISRIKDELINCKRPIFFFHDDADGLCSFLLLYRYIKEGKGVIVKSKPSVDAKFAKKVIDYEADKVFVLDIALMEQEFVDAIKRAVIWIDHHSPIELDKVVYFNPRKHKKEIIYPVTNICYDIVQQDLWIAMVGCVADWCLPAFKNEFCEKYPELLDKGIIDPGKAIFESKLGQLTKIFNFVLKGTSKEAMECVKILTRIQDPYEILKCEASQGKFVYKRFEKINKMYDSILHDVMIRVKKDDRFIVYTYLDNKMSFTGELANELLYKYPDKIIIVGREKSGEIRMSLRSSQIKLPERINNALVGLEGYGGGHEYACGASVKKEQFELFVDRIKKSVQ